MKKSFFVARMKMADLIAANPMLILVMPRLGIPLGFGEKSVQEVCDQQGLPSDFVLLMCNVYTFDDFEPDAALIADTDLHLLVPYLQRSHQYYLKERLPHIRRHLASVAERAGERYGRVLSSFFADYGREVSDHFECEEREIFPYMQTLLEGDPERHKVSDRFISTHSDLVDKLQDLTQIVYKYIPGDCMIEELNELVFAIIQLSEDLKKHTLIEEKILLPYLSQLERRPV